MLFDLTDRRSIDDDERDAAASLVLITTSRRHGHDAVACSAPTAQYAMQCVNPCELVPVVTNNTMEYHKFLEIISLAPELLSGADDGPFRVAHLCEAPGSFIDALVDRVSFVDWHAISLKRAGSIQFYSRHIAASRVNGRQRVHGGGDDTGDLLRPTNCDRFCRDVGLASISLVTADGDGHELGLGSEQNEVVHVRLAAAETGVALQLLADRGSFVLRLFDTVHPDTVSLVASLCTLFRRVIVTQPRASPTGSAERYLLCLHVKRDHPMYASVTHQMHAYAFDGESMPNVVVPAYVYHNLNLSVIAINEAIEARILKAKTLAVFLDAVGLRTPEAIAIHRAEQLKQSPAKLRDAHEFVASVS